MKYQDNNKVKSYYHKIINSSKGLDIVSFDEFIRVLESPSQEIFFFENGLVRISNIIPYHKAEMHAYVFGHRAFYEINKFLFCLSQVMKKFSLHRIECTVPEGSKGLQRLLRMVQFREEGIVYNGCYVNNKVVDGIRFSYLRR